MLIVDSNRESAEETQRMIASDGGTASVCRADATRSKQCEAFARACVDEFGRIDILHNNAAVMQGDDEITQLDEAVWDRIQAVNVKGMFLSCRAVVPYTYG